jgi:hypothetical protein
MQTNLKPIQDYLKNKKICLVGNATSVLNSFKDVDHYEIVGRMNRGVPQGNEPFIGSRTDLLFTSTKLRDDMIQKFNPQFVVWMTKDTQLTTPWLKEMAYQNPPEDWEDMKSSYPEDRLPSTGILVIQFLLKHIEFKKLTLIGFDNFQTSTFYHQHFNQIWHSGELEKKLINLMIEEDERVEWIRE